jgi:hypothetical protein
VQQSGGVARQTRTRPFRAIRAIPGFALGFRIPYFAEPHNLTLSLSTRMPYPVLQRRQNQQQSYTVYDDQGPQLLAAYTGEWFDRIGGDAEGYFNNTLSFTTKAGSSMMISFEGLLPRFIASSYLIQFTILGTQGILVGALPAGNTSYPSATYSLDGSSLGTSSPWKDVSGLVVYYSSPQLSASKHTLQITVTQASTNTPFFVDAFYFTPNSNVQTSGLVVTQTAIVHVTDPASEANGTNTASIVGGVVGGVIGLIALVLIGYYFMRWRRNQPYYFDKPSPGDMLSGGVLLFLSMVSTNKSNAEVQPFPYSTTHSAQLDASVYSTPSVYSGASRYGPSGYGPPESERSNAFAAGVPLLSNRSSVDSHGSPPASEGGFSQPAPPRRGKVALMQQSYNQPAPEPIHHADSGVRFNAAGPSGVSVEVPPSYSAD